jgi:hypothetical protein
MPIFQGEAPLQLRCNRTDSSNSFRSAAQSSQTAAIKAAFIRPLSSRAIRGSFEL